MSQLKDKGRSAIRSMSIHRPPVASTQSWIRSAFLCSVAIGSAQTVQARPEFLDLVRHTLKFAKGGTVDQASCSLCHAASGPPAWNPFGSDVHAALQARNTHALTAEILRSIMKLDSDKDGYSNGAEIAADTLPGDPKSHPAKHTGVSEPDLSGAAASSGAGQPPNPFSPTSILLTKDAQHPALVHFPIALFIVSVGLDLVGKWKKNRTVVEAAAINLTLAALSAVVTVVTGILAWRLKFEGMPLAGNLLLHFAGGLTTTAVIWTLLLMRRKREPSALYLAIAMFGLLVVSLTGHLGGVVSGVAN